MTPTITKNDARRCIPGTTIKKSMLVVAPVNPKLRSSFLRYLPKDVKSVFRMCYHGGNLTMISY